MFTGIDREMSTQIKEQIDTSMDMELSPVLRALGDNPEVDIITGEHITADKQNFRWDLIKVKELLVKGYQISSRIIKAREALGRGEQVSGEELNREVEIFRRRLKRERELKKKKPRGELFELAANEFEIWHTMATADGVINREAAKSFHTTSLKTQANLM